MVPLYFTEDVITWVASELSGAAGVLGVEEVELRNWLIFFGCAMEELRVIIANMADWEVNSYPPPVPHITHLWVAA